MSVWWNGGFFLVVVCVVVVNSKTKLDSPQRISLCESFCLAKCFNTSLVLRQTNASKICSSHGFEEGCKHVCRIHSGSPPLDSPLNQTRIIVRGLGLEKSLGLTEDEEQRFTKEATLWRLREVSRVHQSALVLLHLSWLPQQLGATSQPVYLVTWEVGGGVLRGNLLTNSTRVALSLWPDTEYKIQVTVFSGSSQDGQSEPLVVDTHCSPASDLPGTVLSSPPRTLVHDSLVVGVVGGVAMFFFVTFFFTWRRQPPTFPHSKLIVEECESPNIYRVFPPAVRLLRDPADPPRTFSSWENLITD